MAIENVISELDLEIVRLTQARNLLVGDEGGASFSRSANGAKPTGAPRKKRVLSPEARAKIAAAQKKRWAKQKSAAKPTAKAPAKKAKKASAKKTAAKAVNPEQKSE